MCWVFHIFHTFKFTYFAESLMYFLKSHLELLKFVLVMHLILVVAIDLIVQTIKDLLLNPRIRSSSPLSPPPNLQAQMDQFRRSRVSVTRSISVGTPPNTTRPH